MTFALSANGDIYENVQDPNENEELKMWLKRFVAFDLLVFLSAGNIPDYPFALLFVGNRWHTFLYSLFDDFRFFFPIYRCFFTKFG